MQDYFKSRHIEIKATDLADLAAKEPADGKTQVAQLLAIRWLGEHGAEVKKASKVRETLEEIALGKKGKDAQGFARDYARAPWRNLTASLRQRPEPCRTTACTSRPCNGFRKTPPWWRA